MNSKAQHFAGALSGAALRATVGLVAIVGAAPLRAQEAAPAAEGRPLLGQLARETQGLHREVRRGVLRVELPPPRWMESVAGGGGGGESPLTKYQGLDPKVRQRLERRAAEGEPLVRATVMTPATSRATEVDAQPPGDVAVIVVQTPAGAAPSDGATGRAAFSPNNVAIVIDGRGHLLVPVYLEREAAAAATLRVAEPEGNVVPAKFVGSDRATNLTVLELERPAGEPVRLGAEDRPAEGSLVLMVTPQDGGGRLGMWTGAGKDYGVVFGVDGTCAGVARFGQFLSGRACRLIAEQIIRHGSVKRATLGVIVSQVEDATGPAAAPAAAASNPRRSGLRVDQVMAGSPAEKAGIRVGDLVASLGGEPVRDIPSFAAAIAARSGPTIIELSRDGRAVTVTVELQQK